MNVIGNRFIRRASEAYLVGVNLAKLWIPFGTDHVIFIAPGDGIAETRPQAVASSLDVRPPAILSKVVGRLHLVNIPMNIRRKTRVDDLTTRLCILINAAAGAK
jgi:hypothetical protein